MFNKIRYLDLNQQVYFIGTNEKQRINLTPNLDKLLEYEPTKKEQTLGTLYIWRAVGNVKKIYKYRNGKWKKLKEKEVKKVESLRRKTSKKKKKQTGDDTKRKLENAEKRKKKTKEEGNRKRRKIKGRK